MKKEYKNNYITFYPKKDKRGFCISYSPWSYFDSRPEIMTYLSSILINIMTRNLLKLIHTLIL